MKRDVQTGRNRQIDDCGCHDKGKTLIVLNWKKKGECLPSGIPPIYFMYAALLNVPSQRTRTEHSGVHRHQS